MFDEPAITKNLVQSIATNRRFFVLSSLTKSDLRQTIVIHDIVWSKRKQHEFAHDLASLSLCFPWSEHPAHALFTSVIEQWQPIDLETMLQDTLDKCQAQAVTNNVHLATVLNTLAHPHQFVHTDLLNNYRFGEITEILRKMVRTYILDPTSQAADRQKLGFTRPLTTQDRYHLLSFARDVHRFATSIRSHWGIENSVHYR